MKARRQKESDRKKAWNDENCENSVWSSQELDDPELTHTDVAEDQSEAVEESDAPRQKEPETLTDPSTLKNTVTSPVVVSA